MMDHRHIILGAMLMLLSFCHASEQDIPMGIDGLRCDSCGMECSTVCGSRAFRTCCFNYIKKRSTGGGGGGGDLSIRSNRGKLRRGRMTAPSGLWMGDAELGEGSWGWFYPPPQQQPPLQSAIMADDGGSRGPSGLLLNA